LYFPQYWWPTADKVSGDSDGTTYNIGLPSSVYEKHGDQEMRPLVYQLGQVRDKQKNPSKMDESMAI